MFGNTDLCNTLATLKSMIKIKMLSYCQASAMCVEGEGEVLNEKVSVPVDFSTIFKDIGSKNDDNYLWNIISVKFALVVKWLIIP